MPAKKKPNDQPRKIFVLDTSVILHDHQALQNFDEHDVVLPITVLEELDQFKKGNDSLHYEARSFIRMLDELAKQHSLQDWIPLNESQKSWLKVEMHESTRVDAHTVFGERKADHRILNSAMYLVENYPGRQVILVTKDVNLRLKAKALGLEAEDYRYGKIKNQGDSYNGYRVVDGATKTLIDQLYQSGYCDPAQLNLINLRPNEFLIVRNGKESVLACFHAEEGRLEKVDKRPAYGIRPRNAEQTFALHAVLTDRIRLATLQGIAGTGKTLLALAGALEQRRQFKQLYLARPIVPLSNKDIGYLPGDIKSKLNPYMEPLWDNLKFIQHQFGEADRDFHKINEMVQQEKLTITPLAYIRGRSFSQVCFIVDEAQNLTPHEVKTIITRAGEGTKIIFTGDVRQIDTPYLDAESNGLSYLIERFKGQPLFAHITLQKGERSELANLANELL